MNLLKPLGFLHQQNIIHADLKPENILLKEGNYHGVGYIVPLPIVLIAKKAILWLCVLSKISSCSPLSVYCSGNYFPFV